MLRSSRNTVSSPSNRFSQPASLAADLHEDRSKTPENKKGAFVLIRYILAWFLLLALAVANGVLRQSTFGKAMPELRAHQLSTLIGSVLIGIAVWFIIRVWPPSSSRQAVAIGFIWLVLTVAFEFFMGLVLAGRPLPQVLYDYNILAGRVWVLFLIWLTVAPRLFYRLQRAD